MHPKEIADIMLEKKASDIKIFNVKKITSMTDYFIICSVDSDPQSKAITNNIEKRLKKNGIKPISIEGRDKFEWVLMDYMTFIIHIFNNEKRSYYNLDRLWADAEVSLIMDKEN